MSHPSLNDPFGRRIDYLRLSVTDRCDLRCGYCLPKGFKGFEEPEHWLRRHPLSVPGSGPPLDFHLEPRPILH